MLHAGTFIATFGYLGYVRVAPGTFGSAAGLGVYWGVRSFGSPAIEAAVMAAVFAVGVWSSTVAERHMGRIDPGPVIIDEVAGMLITLAFLPVTLLGSVVGFLLFRVFDIVKPWPSSRFERLPGGLGIMADDGMAAVYGNLVMRALMLIAPAGWLT